MGSPYEISLVRYNCQLRSPGSLCFLAIFGPAQYSMNPYVYLTDFGRTWSPSDAVRARADAVRALEQPTTSFADQHGQIHGL